MNQSKSSLAFELSFYERLLQKDPCFIDALTALAHTYTQSGQYEKGLAIDQKLCALKKTDETAFYNLACSYALLNMHNEAFLTLEHAIELGYADIRHLQKDPDLHSLRNDLRFSQLITRIIHKSSNCVL